MVAKVDHFGKHVFLQELLGHFLFQWVVGFERGVEWLGAHRLVGLELFAHVAEVLVVECFLHRYPLIGVEHQHFLQQINAVCVLIREEAIEWNARVLHAADGLLGSRMLEECHVFLARLTNEFHCAAQLVHVIAAGQEGLPKQELSVSGLKTSEGVQVPCQKHVCTQASDGTSTGRTQGRYSTRQSLRRSGNCRTAILGHGTIASQRILFDWCPPFLWPNLHGYDTQRGGCSSEKVETSKNARQRTLRARTEIANDQVAVGVDENIGGFQVAVHDSGRVDELQTLQHLVEEVLVVGVTEFLSHADQAVEIALVPVEDEVQVVEVGGSGWRGHDVTELDDVVVVGQMTQQLDFAKDTLRVDEILEHVRHFLDGDTVADDDVVGGAHSAVGAAGDVLEVLVADIDLEDVALSDVDLVVVAAASNVELFGSEADSTQVLAEAGSGGGSARAGLRGLLTLTEPLGCSGGRRRLHSRAHCRLLGTAGGACRASSC